MTARNAARRQLSMVQSRVAKMFARLFSSALLLVWFSAPPSHARAPSLAHCGGVVREVGGAYLELTANGRRIEVRVRDRDDRALAASGFVSTVIGGQPMRLALEPLKPGLLAVVAPQVPAAGTNVIIRLSLADGSRRGARLPLSQRQALAACES